MQRRGCGVKNGRRWGCVEPAKASVTSAAEGRSRRGSLGVRHMSEPMLASNVRSRKSDRRRGEGRVEWVWLVDSDVQSKALAEGEAGFYCQVQPTAKQRFGNASRHRHQRSR